MAHDGAHAAARTERRIANIRSLAADAQEAFESGDLDTVEDRIRRVLGYIDSFGK